MKTEKENELKRFILESLYDAKKSAEEKNLNINFETGFIYGILDHTITCLEQFTKNAKENTTSIEAISAQRILNYDYHTAAHIILDGTREQCPALNTFDKMLDKIVDRKVSDIVNSVVQKMNIGMDRIKINKKDIN